MERSVSNEHVTLVLYFGRATYRGRSNHCNRSYRSTGSSGNGAGGTKVSYHLETIGLLELPLDREKNKQVGPGWDFQIRAYFWCADRMSQIRKLLERNNNLKFRTTSTVRRCIRALRFPSDLNPYRLRESITNNIIPICTLESYFEISFGICEKLAASSIYLHKMQLVPIRHTCELPSKPLPLFSEK